MVSDLDLKSSSGAVIRSCKWKETDAAPVDTRSSSPLRSFEKRLKEREVET